MKTVTEVTVCITLTEAEADWLHSFTRSCKGDPANETSQYKQYREDLFHATNVNKNRK